MTAPGELPPTSGGLAWPPHPHDPGLSTPPTPTKKPARKFDTWDRVKFILLLGIIFFVFVWNEIADNPLLPVSEAVRTVATDKAWLFGLLALEVLRQFNHLISEHSANYNYFWSQRVFGRWNARLDEVDPWMRYRVSRAIKVVVGIIIVGAIVGALTGESFVVALFQLPSTIYSALPFILQLVLIMTVAVGQFVAIFWFLSRGGVEVYFPEDVETRFSDVWGQDPVLTRVQENIVFLENPESIEEKGGYVPGGVLLWGPPGTGKTLIAEAVAGETGKPFVFVDPGAFINMFFGVGILKVKSLFRKLRKLALRYGGVIVFFDEADTLGNRGQTAGGFTGMSTDAALSEHARWMSPASIRALVDSDRAESDGAGRRGVTDGFVMGAGMGGGAGGMGTLQALLTELSGLKKPRGFLNRYLRRAMGMKPKPPPKYRILVMMATNLPDVLDPALLRPGRIDRIYKVGYPSKDGRMRTYQGYLDKVKHQLTPEQVDRLAVITPYATGASIKDMVNEALVIAIRDGRETITYQDVLQAKKLKEYGPPDDVEYIERERHATAIHEACHAITAFRLRRHMIIDIATIEKGQQFLGMVSNVPIEEQFTSWRSELEADIMVGIASLAGERMFFGGDSSSGVSSDLHNATLLALRMEGIWGMGPAVGSYVADLAPPSSTPVYDGTDRTVLETEFGRRAEARLQALYERVTALLEENRVHVLAIAHALETYRTLSGEDIEAIVEGGHGPTVDGTLYQRDDFAALAEEYHEAALEAHNRHGRVPIPLPVLNGYRPVVEVAPVGEVAAVPAAPAPKPPPRQPDPSDVPTFLPPPPPPSRPSGAHGANGPNGDNPAEGGVEPPP